MYTTYETYNKKVNTNYNIFYLSLINYKKRKIHRLKSVEIKQKQELIFKLQKLFELKSSYLYFYIYWHHIE